MSASRRAPHRKTPYRKTLYRKTPKITLIAAGSALALAGIAAGTVAAWPGNSPAASASVAGASLAGPAAGSAAQARTLAGAAARDNGLAKAAQDLKAREAAARVAALRQAVARQEARKAARARAAAAAQAAARAPARAAAQRKQAAAAPAAAAQPATPTGSPQQIARGMLGSYGWAASQFSCLQPLWNAESGWNVSAANTSSGAYGIPQALPGSKMASAGARTGRPTRPPRSAGAWGTSGRCTAPRAGPGRMSRPTAGTSPPQARWAGRPGDPGPSRRLTPGRATPVTPGRATPVTPAPLPSGDARHMTLIRSLGHIKGASPAWW